MWFASMGIRVKDVKMENSALSHIAHVSTLIEIIASNSKNNVEHKGLAKTIMESDSLAVKLIFNWLEEYKPFDEI